MDNAARKIKGEIIINIDIDPTTSKERFKKYPKFKYPSEISEPLEFVALLKIHDAKSFCFSSDKVIITCLPNVDMADSTVLYEIVRASKKENRVYIDLNVTNKQLWPFDFAAFTLISVKDGNNMLGQIDPVSYTHLTLPTILLV